MAFPLVVVGDLRSIAVKSGRTRLRAISGRSPVRGGTYGQAHQSPELCRSRRPPKSERRAKLSVCPAATHREGYHTSRLFCRIVGAPIRKGRDRLRWHPSWPGTRRRGSWRCCSGFGGLRNWPPAQLGTCRRSRTPPSQTCSPRAPLEAYSRRYAKSTGIRSSERTPGDSHRSRPCCLNIRGYRRCVIIVLPKEGV